MRLFFAAFPQIDDLTHLQSLQKLIIEAAGAANMHPLKPASLHVTLCFIGECEAAYADRMRQPFVREAENVKPFNAQGTSLLELPGNGKPRVIAMQLDSGGMLEKLAEGMRRCIVSASLPPPSGAYLPHLSLVHVRQPATFSLAAVPTDMPLNLSIRFSRLGLYASQLTPQGAIYEPVFEFSPIHN